MKSFWKIAVEIIYNISCGEQKVFASAVVAQPFPHFKNGFIGCKSKTFYCWKLFNKIIIICNTLHYSGLLKNYFPYPNFVCLLFSFPWYGSFILINMPLH